jgi:putative transcription factor
VTLSFKLALQKARQAKGWSQKDLAQRLNVKNTVINDYEGGRAIPDGGLISRMNRVLGTKLPKIPKKKKVKDDN